MNPSRATELKKEVGTGLQSLLHGARYSEVCVCPCKVYLSELNLVSLKQAADRLILVPGPIGKNLHFVKSWLTSHGT